MSKTNDTDVAYGCVIGSLGCLAIITRLILLVAILWAGYMVGQHFGIW